MTAPNNAPNEPQAVKAVSVGSTDIKPTPWTWTADSREKYLPCVKCGATIGVKPDADMIWVYRRLPYWQWCAPCADADRKQRSDAPNDKVERRAPSTFTPTPGSALREDK